MKVYGVVFVLGALAGTCASPENSFYPNLSSPDVITAAHYDAVPRGAAHETRTSASDGAYAYCSMPHPSVDMYKEPEPVRNGSVHAELKAVLYMQRHQKRTAYHIFPHGEATLYNCDDGRPYLYYSPSDKKLPQPMHVYAQTYADATNPLTQSLANSSCQFPQMTIGGYLDGVQHGAELRALYQDKYNIIPGWPSPRTVWFRSSTAALTQDSAGGVLRGLWPHWRGAIPLHQQSEFIDTHAPPCDRRDALLDAAKSTATWKKHLRVSSSLRSKLESMLLTNTSEWRVDWDHYNDNFQARLCNGYALPCALHKDKDCVTTEEANQVFTAGDWEYNYYWVDRDNVTEAIQLTSGLLIQDMVTHLTEIANGKSALRYLHMFMHDGDIAPLAGSLGIETLRWPGMASNIAIELWESKSSGMHARVLYSGNTIRSKHGNMDWIPLDKFLHGWSRYIPHDFVAQCATPL
ncbi:hypothetical protein MVES1_004014 [Malassezia vespertilionis]|uniref:Acid phosphatase n=1 Tax=Malassezia vespertilionis TaxID=2020962 RepID=A0A2N1J7I7_9BASI|nr:uncharacterized protein MVES1_004014 [Malassezia vespertilionis]PKI82516.1 hypothetical protein MVES_003563 [Malassezia vespertilionis]WFD08637.1 hypothetical protein MVES1_004014 [Malassezia vespertilionis]